MSRYSVSCTTYFLTVPYVFFLGQKKRILPRLQLSNFPRVRRTLPLSLDMQGAGSSAEESVALRHSSAFVLIRAQIPAL